MKPAVGAGEHHHDELALDVYQSPRTRIYVDNWASARTELATLQAPIVGEVGDLINSVANDSNTGITIFHSMGECINQSPAHFALNISELKRMHFFCSVVGRYGHRGWRRCRGRSTITSTIPELNTNKTSTS